MADEDRMIRNIISKCGDSTTCSKLNRKMRATDSAHADNLYNHVRTKGWPTLEDGSRHASLLAIHDHSRHAYYLQHLKEAVRSGQADIGALGLINTWLVHYRHDESFAQRLERDNYIRFDVTSLLNYSMPGATHRAAEAAKKYCERLTGMFFVFEAPEQKIYDGWLDKNPPGKHDHIFSMFLKELQPSCPKVILDPVWDVRHLPGETVKLIFYVTYRKRP